MRYIKLTEIEQLTLEEGYKNHKKSHFRIRCHALLLSNNGMQVKEIAKIFETRTRTIYTWFDRWIEMGLVGLMILPGRGRNPQLSVNDPNIVDTVKKKVVLYPRSLRKMASKLSEDFGIEVSCDMLRRFLKRLGYTWKRFRKSLKRKQDPVEYQAKLAELKQLIELYKSGFIDLYFADESGFNMEGYIPYGWQPKGEYVEITPSKTKGTQVFGLMTLDNKLEAYTYKGSLNSETTIAFLNDFQKGIKQKTVVVMDNAPIHKSKLFLAQIEAWKENDLYVWFLPKYSPHLNPIEILWRMLKYQWIEYENILTQEELDQNLQEILNEFGNEYTINFKEHDKNVSNIFL